MVTVMVTLTVVILFQNKLTQMGFLQCVYPGPLIAGLMVNVVIYAID
jgi:hypothetical protein